MEREMFDRMGEENAAIQRTSALVDSWFALSWDERVAVMRQVGLEDEFDLDSPFSYINIITVFLKRSDKEFWDAIHKVRPFKDTQNPFTQECRP